MPSVVAPSMKVTVPVAADGVTVAVKVTDWPEVEGLIEEATAVVVFALLMFNVPVSVSGVPPPAAETVKIGVPAGVVVRVVMVKVDVFVSPLVKLTGFGENDDVAPPVNAGVMLRVTFRDAPLPVVFTLIVYVALPAVP